MIKPLIRAVVLVVAAIIVSASTGLGAAVCVDPVGVWADGPVKALATRGNLSLVGAGPVLMIIDAEDPAHPVVLSRITLAGTILDLAVNDDVVTAALGGHGAAVVDIANPSAPSQVAILTVGGFAEAVASAGEVFAVVVSSGPVQETWKLEFFDLSRYDDPQTIGSIEFSGGEDFYGRYDAVTMDDRFAYWSAGPTTLVISFDDPSGPRLVNQHDHQGFAHCWVSGTSISEGRLVIAHSWLSGNLRSKQASLGVFAIEPMGELDRIGSWIDEDASWGDSTVTDDRVAIIRYAGDNAILLFSIANPFHPILIGGLDLHYSDWVDRLALGSESLIASDGDLRIAEFVGPTGLSWVSSMDTAEAAVAVAAESLRGYVATRGTRTYPMSYLYTLDLSRPTQPSEIARAPFDTSHLIDLAVIQDRLVTISELDEILTYDVSDPGSPVIESRIEIPGDNLYGQDALVAASQVLYVVWHGGLGHNVVSMVDFSDPSDPEIVNDVAIGAGVRGMSMFGNHLMVATTEGMWLFDTTVETAPSLLSVTGDVGTWLRCGAIGDGAAYFGDDDGLHVLDLTNPEQPVVAGFQRIEGGVWRLVVTPGFLWARLRPVSPGNSGDLLVYDIRDPLHPVLVNGPIGPRGMTEVFRMGSHALVASGTEGLEIVSTRCRYSAEIQRPPLVID